MGSSCICHIATCQHSLSFVILVAFASVRRLDVVLWVSGTHTYPTFPSTPGTVNVLSNAYLRAFGSSKGRGNSSQFIIVKMSTAKEA